MVERTAGCVRNGADGKCVCAGGTTEGGGAEGPHGHHRRGAAPTYLGNAGACPSRRASGLWLYQSARMAFDRSGWPCAAGKRRERRRKGTIFERRTRCSRICTAERRSIG